MDPRQQAIDECSCPRPPGESLESPVCAVDYCVEGHGTSVLFVSSPAGLSCEQLNSYGGKQFCACKKRLQVYRAYQG